MPDNDAGCPLKGPTLVAAVLFVLAIAAVAAVLLKEGLGPMLALIATWRSAAALPFVVIYVIAAIILVPDSLLTLAAGAIFGLGRGLLLVSLGGGIGEPNRRVRKVAREKSHKSPHDQRFTKHRSGVLWACNSTTCSACQPRPQAHHGTITAHPIWARHIPGTGTCALGTT
jgi:hypothetical protein